MTKTLTECRIYVACLACYNAGRLVGEWMDAARDADDIRADIAAMMQHDTHGDPCPHEETAIHDYELSGAKIGEFESIDHVAKLASCIEEHGEAFVAWYDNETRDADDDWSEQFQEVYRGTHKSLADYAEELSEELGDLESVPERLRYHIDWDSVAREMEIGGDVWTADVSDGVAVFWNS